MRAANMPILNNRFIRWWQCKSLLHQRSFAVWNSLSATLRGRQYCVTTCIQAANENTINTIQHCCGVFCDSLLTCLLLHSFNGLFSWTTWVSRHRKDKPFWILLKQEMMGWQWHQLDHMQIICTTLQSDNLASMPSLSFLLAGCSSWRTTNSVNALKALAYLLKSVKVASVLLELTGGSVSMQLLPSVELSGPVLVKSSSPVNVSQQEFALQVRVHSPVVEHHLIHQLTNHTPDHRHCID